MEKAGRAPVERIDLLGRSVSLYLIAGTDLGSVFDFSLFSGITPGMTVEEAQQLLGFPPQHETLFKSPAFFFTVPDGKVALVKRTVESEGPAVEKWELYAFPKDPRPQRLIAPSVLDQIPNLAQYEEVALIAAGEGGSVYLFLAKGEVQRIAWGRRGRTKAQSHLP